MKCADAAAKLAAYMDRELKPDDLRDVEAHLGRCGSCREELQSLEGVDALIKALPREAISAESAGRLVLEASGDARGQENKPLGLSLFLLSVVEAIYDLLHPRKSPGTGTLDELGDAPASFMAHAYFSVMGSSVSGK